MVETEELLEKCSELTIVMAELEKEVPKLRKYFTECKKLHKDFCKQINEDESVLNQRFDECQQNLDKQMNKISAAIKKYEKAYDSIVGNEEVLAMIQKNAEIQAEMQKRMLQFEERFENMEMAVQNPDSLRSVLWKAGYRFPIQVHKEGKKPWTADYYFEVERVEAGFAYGNVYKGNKIYKTSERRSLDEAPFSIYKKHEQINRIYGTDGFMNIPDGIDDELPFN